MIKLLRTIRFDRTDERVFECAAPAEEWAVPGSFAFVDLPADAFIGKTRQAFANGFLGLPSFGRSTFATVAEVPIAVRDEIVELLATHFVERASAPDLDHARVAARQELDFVCELCAEAPINTVFTLRRTRDEAGEIAEEFRIIKPPTGEPMHARIWNVEQDDA